jgi:hypothetical protein
MPLTMRLSRVGSFLVGVDAVISVSMLAMLCMTRREWNVDTVFPTDLKRTARTEKASIDTTLATQEACSRLYSKVKQRVNTAEVVEH